MEGEIIGKLKGLDFCFDSTVQADFKLLRSAARRAVCREIDKRITRMTKDPGGAFRIDEHGYVSWREFEIAKLVKGRHILAPSVEPLVNHWLEGVQRDQIRMRVQKWLDKYIRKNLAKLFRLQSTEIEGAARGLVFQVVEQLGSTSRVAAQEQVDALRGRDRRFLSRMGLRIGKYSVFVGKLVQPEVVRFRALLCSIFLDRMGANIKFDGSAVVRLERADLRCIPYVGYHRFGDLGLRVDLVERLSILAHQKARQGSFVATADLVNAAGCDGDDLIMIMSGLGYKAIVEDIGVVFSAVHRKRTRLSKRGVRKNTKLLTQKADSPFAKLSRLNTVK